jgi:5-methylcytosine-specific restriction endonuclease McrA
MTVVVWETALELEHEIPLWMVEHLPPWERRRYFGPTNLKLRCKPCHQRKTAREAEERAHGNRLRDPKSKSGGRRLQSRPMGPSRGFEKGHRPLRS